MLEVKRIEREIGRRITFEELENAELIEEERGRKEFYINVNHRAYPSGAPVRAIRFPDELITQLSDKQHACEIPQSKEDIPENVDASRICHED